MALERQQADGIQTVDVKVSIPELKELGSFWLRDYGTHHTFADLYQECINHPDVSRFRAYLEGGRGRASRHFWCGEQMLLREKPLQVIAPKTTGGRSEISLVLRRDCYQIGPPQHVSARITESFVYLDAEVPTENLISVVLSEAEKPCCFDLRDHHKRRLDHSRSLAAYELWPAWEEATSEPFPDRAILWLQPRITWLPYALLAGAFALGLSVGYWLLTFLLTPRPT